MGTKVFMVVHDAASMTFGQGGGKDHRPKVGGLVSDHCCAVALDLNPVTGDCRHLSRSREFSVSYLDLSFGSRTAIACVPVCQWWPKTLRCSLESALVPLFDGFLGRKMPAILQQRLRYWSLFLFLSRGARRPSRWYCHPPSSFGGYCGSAIDKLSGWLM
jgi:hypothetical protein